MNTAITSGRLITLEGVEGAGKSSQIEGIRECIEAVGHTVMTTREPGGTDLAEAIRKVLLDGEDMPALTELLLMFAARSSHFIDKIRPALARGEWVVCDRFIDASYAYQAAGRGLSEQYVQSLESMTLEDRKPDLVLLFDLDVEVGLQRARSRGEENRFDKEDISFMQRVRDAYLGRAKAEPDRYKILRAEASMEQVSADVTRVMTEFLNHAA